MGFSDFAFGDGKQRRTCHVHRSHTKRALSLRLSVTFPQFPGGRQQLISAYPWRNLSTEPSLDSLSVFPSFSLTTNPSITSWCARASAESDTDPSVLTTPNVSGGVFRAGIFRAYSDFNSIDVDAVTETELKENGFRSTRRTKLIRAGDLGGARPPKLSIIRQA